MMVLFKKKSDKNIHQNAPDCINHFKIFSGSMPPNPLACVLLISLFQYESSQFFSKYTPKYLNCSMFSKISLVLS